MDKFPNCAVDSPTIHFKIDEIVDWLNAHDEREAKARDMLPMQPCKDWQDELQAQMAEQDTEEHRVDSLGELKEELRRDDLSQVGQELEAGLSKFVSKSDVFGYDCTRIYLPEAKCLEYARTQTDLVDSYGIPDNLTFHDIPVYCGGPDIHYCTD